MKYIDLSKQQKKIKPELDRRIARVLAHGKYIMGPEIKELEERLQDYTGSKYCITVSSGTEALLISLMALNIGPGDEVITTPFSFIATAEVIVNVGATPVFVDIEQDTYNIDAAKVEAAITNKTKAIIPVSLYGQPSDMNEINVIAAKYDGITVVEDAAQSFGATYNGKKSCNLSSVGCTSFFPSKPLGCYGDGGAIFTRSDEVAQACREIREHGQSNRYIHTRVGVGGRMDTLQAAIILAKLEIFNEEVALRQQIASEYTELIMNSSKQVVPPKIKLGRTSVYGQYTVLSGDRDGVQQRMSGHGIPTAVHYPVPINQQPAYKRYKTNSTPVAFDVAKKVISLPMPIGIKSSEISEIVGLL